MGGIITYMGTKRSLLATVQQAIADCRPGPLLDAFAGMGAVAESVSQSRRVWLNDVQVFSQLAARCRFTSKREPPTRKELSSAVRSGYIKNYRSLVEQNQALLCNEKYAFKADDFSKFISFNSRISNSMFMGSDAYSCLSERYSIGYFSARQTIEADSIYAGLATALGHGSIDKEAFDWGVLHLGRALLRVANTTGHFAQYLTPNEKNFKRVARQGLRHLWREWNRSLTEVGPVRDSQWRSENHVSGLDSRSLSFGQHGPIPSVVYCDPPYTDDQYSRYYHIWETLALYDYPEIAGKGRYRPDRFRTDFSLVSKVDEAFKSLIGAVRNVNADLVLSYPSNGLLYKAGTTPEELIRSEYGKDPSVIEVDHYHSSMGASKGSSKSKVIERIFVATP